MRLSAILRPPTETPAPSIGTDPNVPLTVDEQRLVAVWFRRLLRDDPVDLEGYRLPPYLLGRIATTFDQEPST